VESGQDSSRRLVPCTEERQVDADIRPRELERLDKGDLYDLADGLLSCEREGIGRCVEFILAETKGIWYGRARAMMCLFRLKRIEAHCRTPPRKTVIKTGLRSDNGC
jgi:hypothetical protein